MSDIGINNLSSSQPVGAPPPPPGDNSLSGNQPSVFARYTTYLTDGYQYDKTLGDKMIGGDDAALPRQAIGFVGKVAVVVGGAALRTTGIAALLSFAGSVLHGFAQWVIGKVVNYALDSAISEARKIADPNSDAPPETRMVAGALIAVAEGTAADFASALLDTPDYQNTRDLLIQDGINAAMDMFRQTAAPDSDANPLLRDIAAGVIAVSDGRTDEFTEELLNRPDVMRAKEVAIQDAKDLVWQKASPYVPAASLFVGGAVVAFVADPESSVLNAVCYGVGAAAVGVGVTSVCTTGYAYFISARDSLFCAVEMMANTD